MESRDLTTRLLGVLSVAVLAVVGTVAVAVALRPTASGVIVPGPVVLPEGWRDVTAGGSSYAVPEGWRTQAGPVGYRDADGRDFARGTALSTYAGGCPGGHAAAWAVLAEPVTSRDPAAVATAAARQWARGFAAGEIGTGQVGEPRVREAGMADGAQAVIAELEVDLAGLDNPCGQDSAVLEVVAVQQGRRVAMLVLGRHPEAPGALPEDERRQILRSLT